MKRNPGIKLSYIVYLVTSSCLVLFDFVNNCWKEVDCGKNSLCLFLIKFLFAQDPFKADLVYCVGDKAQLFEIECGGLFNCDW
jgi:hypothetical protein